MKDTVGRLIKFETGQTAMITRVDFREEIKARNSADELTGDVYAVFEVEVELEDGSILVGGVAENDYLISFDDDEMAREKLGLANVIFGFDAFVGEHGEEPTPPGVYFAPPPEGEEDE